MKNNVKIGKLARRLQVAPTHRAAKILSRRPTPPGVHGARRRSNQSVFGLQLVEKQKVRFQFMITEKALKRIYREAQRQKARTGERLLQLLDQRLDATLFRSGVVRSIPAARQLVTHRHIFVNGRRVDKPSFSVRVGDVITFSEKSKSFGFLGEGFEAGIAVSYLEVDRQHRTIQRKSIPSREQIPVQCDEQMIVEYFSR